MTTINTKPKLDHETRQLLKAEISKRRRERAMKAAMIDRSMGILRKDERIGDKAIREGRR